MLSSTIVYLSLSLRVMFFLYVFFTIDLCLTVIYLLLLFSIRGETPCHKPQSFCADPHSVILSSSSCDLK